MSFSLRGVYKQWRSVGLETRFTPSFLVSLPPREPDKPSRNTTTRVNRAPETPTATPAILLRHAASAKNVETAFFLSLLADDDSDDLSKSEVAAASSAKINPLGAISRPERTRWCSVCRLPFVCWLTSAATALNS